MQAGRIGSKRRAGYGRVVLLVALSIVALHVNAEIIAGRVVGITDGDTVKVLTPSPENREIKVRLAGVDAPERGQPFGKASKQAYRIWSSARTSPSTATRSIDTTGSWRRSQYDGRDINLEIVRLGLAWWYRKMPSC
jgi:endonuclease YncB( thermonuclease family)